ncbi:MAG: hypothetical protein JWN86_1595 [Planctomycetota bacterium]|nr:hypothetical protein [Planctomycetota bacterium]
MSGQASAILVVSIVLTLMAQDPATPIDAKARSEKLLTLHADDAASYAIYRDAAKKAKATLRREPVYRWTNPTRVGGQEGDVFLWTYQGRPEVVASIFSHPHHDGKQRVVCHELHSLSESVLVIDRSAPNRWAPKAAGVDLKPIAGAAPPAPTPAQRLVQIRSLAREFSGRSLSDQNQTWELRLLPSPLYRYESTNPDVIDGAVFALVSSAGTDPEVILLIEARKTPQGPRWMFGAARFSDMSLWLKHKDQEVWNAIRGDDHTFTSDARQRFRFYQDRFIPEIVSRLGETAKTKEE